MKADTPNAADLAPTVPSVPSRSLLVVAWQRRSFVLLGLVVGSVIGILVYSQKPAVYQSGAQVLVVKKRSDALPVAGGDPRLSFYEDYVATHLVLLRSPLIVERAVRKRDLGSLKSLTGDPVGIVRAGLAATRDNAKDTTAAPNNIINLSFRGSDSADAAAVLSAVIDSYRDFLDETYRNVSDNTLELINHASDMLKTDIAATEKKYAEFRKNAPLLWRGTDGANRHLIRIKEFQAQQTGLLARAAELREILRAVNNAKETGKPLNELMRLATLSKEKDQPLAPTMERTLQERLFPLELQEKALSQAYGKDYPDLVRVREQIAMTREHISRLDSVIRKGSGGVEGAQGDPLEMQLQELRQKQAFAEASSVALGALIADEEKQARALEAFEIQDEMYRNDIARTTDVLKQTTRRLQEINLVRDSGGFEAKLIAAPAAGAKVAPLAWQILPSGSILGLLAGLGLAYLLDVLDKSFRSPEEIRRRLGLPVVGHIPFLASAGFGKPGGRLDPLLVAHHRTTSTEAEAYRGVRTALYFSTRAERHKVIQVTSPQASDGKSLLIANLAVSIAQSGRRVVVIDADLRRGRLHRIFGLTARAGLASVIGGHSEVFEVVQETGVPNLSVIPCGPRPANPAELLTDPRFEEVLEELRESYDFVLVDTPPLLAVSDPCTVAPRVDGVLFVLRPGKNGRPPAERARDLLIESGARIFGIVVNGVGKSGVDGGGYEHYAVGYEYAPEYADADQPSPVEQAEVRPTVVAQLAAVPENGHAAEAH